MKLKKIILLKDIERLGKKGQVIDVKRGYAVNFLIPKKLAVEFSPQNLKKIEEEEKRKKKKEERLLKEAQDLAKKIETISLTICAKTKDDENLYGSITELQILESLKSEGIELKKENIILEEPIRKIGVYDVKVKLHPEVQTTIKVWVVKK